MSLGPALIWKMGGDTSKFNKAVKGAETRASKFKGVLKSFGPLLATMGLGRMAKAAIDLGSKISDLAVQLNIGTTELQVLDFASREAGVGTEIMARALRNVQLRTEEAIKGNKSYGDAFKALGIDIEAFKKLKTEEKMQAIAVAQQNATDSGAAYNAVARILGEKAGPALQEVLQNLAGPEGYGGLEAAARRAGEVMDKSTIAKLDAAADAIESFKRKSTVMSGEVLVKVVPAFKALGQGLGFVGDAIGLSIINFKSFFSFLAAGLSAVVAPAVLNFKVLGSSIKAAALAASGEFKASAAALADSVDLTKQAFAALKDAPGKIADAFSTMVNDAKAQASDLGEDLEARAGEIDTAWSAMWSSLEDQATTSTDSIATVGATAAAAATEVANIVGEEMKASAATTGHAAAMEEVRALATDIVGLEEERLALLKQLNFDGANGVAIAARLRAIAIETSEAAWSEYRARTMIVKIGTGGDSVTDLSTDKLQHTLRMQQKELAEAKKADSHGAFTIGTKYIQAGITSFINRLEAELDQRQRFNSLSSAGQQLAFDPYQIERLLSVTTPQTQNQQQTDILKDISDKLDIANSRGIGF